MNFDDTLIGLDLDLPSFEHDEEWFARAMEDEPDVLPDPFDPSATSVVDGRWSDD